MGTALIKVGQRGVITLPKRVREQLTGFSTGSVVEVEELDGALLMRPVSRFDRELANDVRSALEDMKSGNYIEFSSIPEFHAKLKLRRKAASTVRKVRGE